MKLTVPTRGGTVTLEAQETGIPGLVWHAETEPKKSGYSITHVKSGYAILIGLPTEVTVERAIHRLKPLPINWTLCRSKLKLSKYKEQVLQIRRELEA